MTHARPGEGHQIGTHEPKAGCWRCVEAFLEDVDDWAERFGFVGGGDAIDPTGSDSVASVQRSFAAWAHGHRIDHGTLREAGGMAH